MEKTTELEHCPHCGYKLEVMEFLWCGYCGDVTELDEYSEMKQREENDGLHFSGTDITLDT